MEGVATLTNLKSLKRSRRNRTSSSGSASSVGNSKIETKRNKVQLKKKKEDLVTDSDHQSDKSEDTSLEKIEPVSEVAIINENEKCISPAIFDDSSEAEANNGDKNNESEKSNSDDDTQKKQADELGAKKVKEIKVNKLNENDSEQASDNDKTDVNNEDKGKWRNDKLLRTKLNESDSEEDLIRFRSKKKKITEEIQSQTKQTLKRIARRLGSESNSSSEHEDAKVNSDSELIENNDSETTDSEPEEKGKRVRRRIKLVNDSEDSSGSEKKDDKSTRKKIRNVWNRESLADTTKAAGKEEEERKKRISDRQKLYNQIYDKNNDCNTKVDKVVLDFNEETKEELLFVDPALVAKLKPHQATGVQFMWTACFESLERAKSTEGSGCILAHCMGLGKTLQVITLVHTLMTHFEKTGIRTVLVVCPLSTVLNWVSEFKKWLDDIDGEQINVFDLVTFKQPRERLLQTKDWIKFGGIMVIGYDMFRNLSNPKGKKRSKKITSSFQTCLVEPGPDLVVCDEGHLLKNEKTGISIAMNRIRTRRRIVLTGTPLQNNLKEYFCMVQFVKPNLLGTYKEYLNRFVNPITNGQYTDSTDRDIKIMRNRSHVLHKMLDGLVERRDYNVLAPFLPPKHEYILFVTLKPVQIELYKEYLKTYSRSSAVKGTSYLFHDFQELQRICIHPRVLLDKSNQDKLRRDKEDDDSEGSLKDFIDDDSDKSTSTNESNSGSESDASAKNVKVGTRKTRANPGNCDDSDVQNVEIIEPENWWAKYCSGDELDNIAHSSKISLLFEILHQCEMIGDKVLVFSQSLFSLNLIEYFLAKMDESNQNNTKTEVLGNYQGSWAAGLDYFRLDGSTSCEKRAMWCKIFNNESNTRARLFLISTRAGGLGINLVAANRVIIFDVSWNPSHDIQSIYRVYRFGQTKPCYIYRFVTMGTMENKVYERQVTKQAISKRVIDEQQIDRHYNQNDLAELYAFNAVPTEERPIPMVPKDRLFADLLQSHEKEIFKYHEHNSLLENKEDEGLNEEERKAAWEEFENEKKAPKFDLTQMMLRSGMYETLRIMIQKDNAYASLTPVQVNAILPTIIQKISEQISAGDYGMYRRIVEEHERRVLEQKTIELRYQQFMQQLKAAPNSQNLQSFMKNNQLAQMMNQQQMPLAGGSATNNIYHADTDIVELDD